jgi:hypothetical protein
MRGSINTLSHHGDRFLSSNGTREGSPCRWQRRDLHPRLQAGRHHQQAVRVAHDLRARAFASDWYSALRFQVRVVQRGAILWILPAHDTRARHLISTPEARRLTRRVFHFAKRRW